MTRLTHIRLSDGRTIWSRDGEVLDAAPWLGGRPSGERAGSGETLAPAAPSKIICVGRNYRDHAKEMGGDVPGEPLLFLKAPSSLLDPGGTVLLPPESARVEHECELAVVIGKRGRRIPKERALEHVLGYTIACDVTARDLQKKDGQWSRAKSFDTFCPLGPEIASGLDPSSLELRLFVNGALRQSGSTRDMVFDVATLLAYASSAMTLLPGDLVLTGTPEGVGPLVAGDEVSLEIEGIGRLGFSVAVESQIWFSP